MTAVLVAAGAAVGSPLRYLVGLWLDGRFPAGTLLVNLLGSAALGVLSGLAVGGSAAALLGTGFCGGFTTCSSFALQAHRLGGRTGTAYVVATVVGALLACTAGFAVGAQA